MYFKTISLLMIGESNIPNQSPRCDFLRMDRLAGIMVIHAALQIRCHADIEPPGIGITLIMWTYFTRKRVSGSQMSSRERCDCLRFCARSFVVSSAFAKAAT
jgi:hypothetical protein